MLHFTSLLGLLRVTARIFESHASKCLSAYVIPISCSTLKVFSATSPHKTRGSSDGRPAPTRLPLQIPCCGLRLRTCGILSRLMLIPVSPVSNHSRNGRHGRQEYRACRLQLVIISLLCYTKISNTCICREASAYFGSPPLILISQALPIRSHVTTCAITLQTGDCQQSCIRSSLSRLIQQNFDPSILLFTSSIIHSEGCRPKDRTSRGIATHRKANRTTLRHHDLTAALQGCLQTLNKWSRVPLRERALKQNKIGTDSHPRTNSPSLQRGAMPSFSRFDLDGCRKW
jgi:hypothetical protein